MAEEAKLWLGKGKLVKLVEAVNRELISLSIKEAFFILKKALEKLSEKLTNTAE